MEDEKVIIYIALCNSCQYYIDALDNNTIDTQEEKELTTYLIDRHLGIIDKYALELGEETPIGRPSWNGM
ncbi:MAG: hypothetical protein RSC49_02175 [Clostridium sp.]